MKPYYDENGITIYHGDCRDFDPPSVDLVLTDPPYGINYQVARQLVGEGHRRVWMGGLPPVYGDKFQFDPSPLLALGPCVLWGANYYSNQLPRGGWIVWDKTGGGRGPDNSFGDVELAWTNTSDRVEIFHHLWKGLVRDSEAGQKVRHPTQKPVPLMRWILGRSSELDDLIFDPYMGSGPIAQACKEMGRRYIGIEIEERYCEIAVQRLAQGVLEFG